MWPHRHTTGCVKKRKQTTLTTYKNSYPIIHSKNSDPRRNLSAKWPLQKVEETAEILEATLRSVAIDIFLGDNTQTQKCNQTICPTTGKVMNIPQTIPPTNWKVNSEFTHQKEVLFPLPLLRQKPVSDAVKTRQPNLRVVLEKMPLPITKTVSVSQYTCEVVRPQPDENAPETFRHVLPDPSPASPTTSSQCECPLTSERISHGTVLCDIAERHQLSNQLATQEECKLVFSTLPYPNIPYPNHPKDYEKVKLFPLTRGNPMALYMDSNISIKASETNVLKERLILNHIIILRNLFGPEACVTLLLFKIQQEYFGTLKSFLLYLNMIREDELPRIEEDKYTLDTLRKM